jgi:Family of unknown function (DUF6521)
MIGGLLNEYEVMLNVGLGAEALTAFTVAFHAVPKRQESTPTLWHMATVLPLVFHEVSRRAITKHQARSGLRSVLERNPESDIAQNEAIFNLNVRLRATFPRTIRSFNCAVSWGLLAVEDGAILVRSTRRRRSISGEARSIISAATKLGTWAGQMTSFEYLTVLCVEVRG